MIDTTHIDCSSAAAALDYAAALEAVCHKTDRVLTAAPSLVRGYTASLAGVRGKMIRAASLLCCAQGDDGLIPPDAVCFAAGVELLHLATLVHDDIIDDADTRRGQPTLQRRFGKRAAVICGDYLLAAALRAAAQAQEREKYLHLQLPDYIGRICQGELSQQLNNGNLELTVYSYLRIIGGKTAALFEATFVGGAVLYTEDERLRRLYGRLGRYIGMIFQLTDDCGDFELDESAAKKPVRADFDQGVVTLPLIHALGAEPALKQTAREQGLTRARIDESVRRSGGLAVARRVSRRYYDKALGTLEALQAPPEKRRRLLEILDKSYQGVKPQE